MCNLRLLRVTFLGSFLLIFAAVTTPAQTISEDQQFGPVVRAYLGYLRNEQGVVDDRVSRHEVSSGYYRRNSNRIRALRQMAMRIARDTDNDYLPELEAVASDELGTLFERVPRFETLRIGEVVQTKFRYLGNVRAGELFHVFARLDPYEQSELLQANTLNTSSNPTANQPLSGVKVVTRARRVSEPR
ncbi:MAG: hypothetical protein M3539_16015 [Acidobacteriota bacterium]|nr:hypothetical protein [Acidobacteriota bacterium]